MASNGHSNVMERFEEQMQVLIYRIYLLSRLLILILKLWQQGQSQTCLFPLEVTKGREQPSECSQFTDVAFQEFFLANLRRRTYSYQGTSSFPTHPGETMIHL